MSKKVFKVFFEWDFEKEEAWLNEMSDKGWKLVKVGLGVYTFEECEPGEYTVRTQFLDSSWRDKKNREYISFVEETGAELAGKLWTVVYFRKKRTDGEFELFSDNASRIKHLNTIITMLLAVGFANLAVGISNLTLGGITGLDVNIIMCILNFVMFACLAFGAHKLNKKKKKLKSDDGIIEK